MSSTVTVKFLGDNKGLVSAVDGAAGAVSKFSRAAAATAAAVAVAGTAMATSAAKAAVEFEGQMGQVFTLLPGISGDAMDDMSGQVLDFSKKMGILPEEVVPALYDSLSAGVPQDNVFEFMEVAGKAAIGGNLEVADAVDLLSTAVNAYAATGLTAAEASDLFFTTVRLGKTTVPELQASFAQIGPVAAALGVGLDEVGASIATLTASGTPTSVAATQMKAALAELAKEGSKAATAFTEMNDGVSFTEFIESGMDLEGAMNIIANSGTPVIEMFGSIDAAQGVLGLIANEGEAFSSALAEMGSSAGATDGAFATMDDTTGRAMDRLKANFSAISIELGNRLLPVVDRVVDWFVVNMPAIQRTVEQAVGVVVGWFRDHLPGAIDTAKRLLEEIKTAFMEVAEPVLDVVVPAIESVVDWIGEQLPDAIDGAVGVAQTIADQWPRVTEAFSATVDWMRSNWPYVVGAMSGIAVLWLSTVIPAAVATTGALVAQAAAWIAATAPVLAAAAAFAAIGAGLVYAYQNVEWFRTAVDAVKDWMVNDLWPTIQAVWEGIKTAIEVAISAAQVVIETAVAAVQAIWETFGDTILSFARSTWDNITQIVQGAIDIVMGIVDVFVGLFTGDWEQLWDGIEKIVDGVWDVITGIIDQALDTVEAALELAWSAIESAASAAWDAVSSTVSDTADAVIGFVTDLPGRILESVGDLAQAGIDLATGFKDELTGVVSDAAEEVVRFIIGLPGRLGRLLDSLKTAGADLAIAMVTGLGEQIVGIVETIISPFREALNTVIGWWNSISFTIPEIDIPEVDIPLVGTLGGGSVGGWTISVPQLPQFADGGWVGRPDAVSNRPVPAILHEGEYVMSRDMIADIRTALADRGAGIHIDKIEVSDGRDLVSEIAMLETIYGTAS